MGGVRLGWTGLLFELSCMIDAVRRAVAGRDEGREGALLLSLPVCMRFVTDFLAT